MLTRSVQNNKLTVILLLYPRKRQGRTIIVNSPKCCSVSPVEHYTPVTAVVAAACSTSGCWRTLSFEVPSVPLNVPLLGCSQEVTRLDAPSRSLSASDQLPGLLLGLGTRLHVRSDRPTDPEKSREQQTEDQ